MGDKKLQTNAKQLTKYSIGFLLIFLLIFYIIVVVVPWMWNSLEPRLPPVLWQALAALSIMLLVVLPILLWLRRERR